MVTVFGSQPIPQLEQFTRGRTEASQLFLYFAALANHQQAGNDRCLMYVQSTTAFQSGFHNASIGGDCCAAGLLQKLPYVLPVSTCDNT
jgi:hypothetical protein